MFSSLLFSLAAAAASAGAMNQNLLSQSDISFALLSLGTSAKNERLMILIIKHG